MTETALVRRLLLRASELGMRLFRNNVGVLKDARGRYVRYGLCNGSSDLIGWTPVVITPEMVGQTVAVFTAVEAKMGKNFMTAEQFAFLNAVVVAGGHAIMARDTADLVINSTAPGGSGRSSLDARGRAATRSRPGATQP